MYNLADPFPAGCEVVVLRNALPASNIKWSTHTYIRIRVHIPNDLRVS